ncbi:MAG TPA: hypothetical protein VJA66_09375 [Thermoanaerobaculia bacterium]
MRQRGPFTRSARAASIGIFGLVLASELVWVLIRAHEDRLHLATGAARWIWAMRDLPEKSPIRFTVKKEFALTRPSSPSRARIFVDRAYELRVNGSLVGSGSQKPGDALDAYELFPTLKPGRNEISIDVSSPTGAGGILFWLDPGDGRTIVSDGSWDVDSKPGAEKPGRAAVWGRPPMYPWGYPPLSRRD